MNGAWLGWALAFAAIVVGWLNWGWRGVLVGVTVAVFWLLLQFNRSVRVLRLAAGRPVGSVDSAVMLHARLHAGMRLAQVLALTRSLGTKLADEPNETFAWADAAGDRVELVFSGGRLRTWNLTRGAAAPEAAATGEAPPAA